MNAAMENLLIALEDHASRWEYAAMRIAGKFPMAGPVSETGYWSRERLKYLANMKALRDLAAKLKDDVAQEKLFVV